MSDAQRVGQLFLVGIAGAPTAEVAQAVRTYHFGSLLWEGTSTAGVAADRQATDAIQALASSAATARVQFFIAANQEGGQVQELQGPGFSEILVSQVVPDRHQRRGAVRSFADPPLPSDGGET